MTLSSSRRALLILIPLLIHCSPAPGHASGSLSQAIGENLVVDPGFEQQPPATGAAVVSPWSAEGPGAVVVDLALPRSGVQDVHVSSQVAAPWTAVNQTVAVAPATDYVLTGWVYSGSSAGAFTGASFGARADDGTVLGSTPLVANQSWVPLTVSFNSGGNAEVTLFAGLAPSGWAGFHLDDVALVAGACSPSCNGAVCGDDGCGGSCGPCPDGQSCSAGQCSGGGNGTWTLVFDDEFDGTSLDTSQWESGLTNGSLDGASVSGGYLQLLDGSGDAQLRSIQSWAYGAFEIRATQPSADNAGQTATLWMLPESSVYGEWPASGEIDITEVDNPGTVYGGQVWGSVGQAWGTSNPPSFAGAYSLGMDTTAFHVYRLEWTPATMTWLVDGNPVGTLSTFQPFDQSFYLILAMVNRQNNWSPSWTPVLIDYVRVYSGG